MQIPMKPYTLQSPPALPAIRSLSGLRYPSNFLASYI
nr:MAG TPA: hypothetical protein [Caudoviricetes sp.]